MYAYNLYIMKRDIFEFYVRFMCYSLVNNGEELSVFCYIFILGIGFYISVLFKFISIKMNDCILYHLFIFMNINNDISKEKKYVNLIISSK